MNCRDFNDRVDAYSERSLPPSDRQWMQRHAMTCDRCRRQLVYGETITAAARLLPRVSAPPGFNDELMRRIRARDHRRLRYLWFPFPRPVMHGLVYAALILGIGLSVSLLRQDRTESPSAISARRAPAQASVSASIPLPWESARRRIPTSETTRLNALWGDSLGASENEFVDFLLKGTGENEVFVRLPRTIIYHAPSNDDVYYVQNISH